MKELKDMAQPELGTTCKELRESKNISVIEFSHMAKCTRQAVYYFESGKTQSLNLFLAYLKLKGE